MADLFKFRRFEVRHRDSALKVGTDAVLLGAGMTIGDDAENALDIGTGCGVIALIVAQRTEGKCRITGIDIDGLSAEEAAWNFARSPWGDMLSAQHCSLDEFCNARPEGEFDLIFSNPPYYDDSLINPDIREAAARHTHSLSHQGLCSCVNHLLSPQGTFCVVLPADSFVRFRRIAASFGLLPYRLLEVSTTNTKPASRIVAEFSRNIKTTVREAMFLQCNGVRSEEFAELTKDFYL